MSESGLPKAEHFYRVRPLFQIAGINVVGLVAANVPSCAEVQECKPPAFWACNKINKRLDELTIQKEVLDRLKELTAPVCHSILSWARECADEYGLIQEFALNPYVAKHGGYRWKWCGILDRVAMAKSITCDEELPVMWRFLVACRYGFKTDIVLLWSQLTIVERRSLTIVPSPNPLVNRTVNYWTLVLTNKMSSYIARTRYQDEIQFGLSLANSFGAMSAVKYFWDQLGSELKSHKVYEYASDVIKDIGSISSERHDILAFYVSQVSVEGQAQLLRDHRYQYLEFLLQWPFQDMFVPAFEAVSSSTDDYGDIFHIAKLPLSYGFTGEIFFKNILSVWSKMSESDHHSMIFDNFYIHGLFTAKARPCLNVMLAGQITEELQGFAFSEKCISCCYSIITDLQNLDGVAEVIRYLVPKNRESLKLFETKLISHLRQTGLWRSCLIEDCEFLTIEGIAEDLTKIVDSYLSVEGQH